MATFVDFLSEIKKLICGNLPPHIAIQLSCTDKKTQEVLNEQFFEHFFLERHPVLKTSHDWAFKDVKLLMPTQFWKVSCRAFADKAVESLPLALIAKESIPVAHQKLEEHRSSNIDQLIARRPLIKEAFERATQEYCAFLDGLTASGVTHAQWIDLHTDNIEREASRIVGRETIEQFIEFFESVDAAVRPFLKFILMKFLNQEAASSDTGLTLFLMTQIQQEIVQNPDSVNKSCLQFVKDVFAKAKTYECASKDLILINKAMTLLEGYFLPPDPSRDLILQRLSPPLLDPAKTLLAEDIDQICTLIDATSCSRQFWVDFYGHGGNVSPESYFRKRLPFLFLLIRNMSDTLTSQIKEWNSASHKDFLLAPNLIKRRKQDVMQNVKPMKSDIAEALQNEQKALDELGNDLLSVLSTKRLPDPRNAAQNNENPV